MNTYIKPMAFAAICCAFISSCTTNVMINEPDPSPLPSDVVNHDEVSISFHISSNSYTRAGETDDEDKIQSLTLAFYKIDGENANYLKSETFSEIDGNNTVSTTFDIINEEIPNAVIAYANISLSEEDLNNALSSNPFTIENLETNGVYVMSSARYYDNTSNHSDIYYSTISDSNYSDETTNGDPVNIYLERVAAKVTVNTSNASLSDMKFLDINGDVRTLKLTLTNWNVSGTDKSSYLVKNHSASSYTAMQAELGSWDWDKTTNHTLSWAHSVNWNKTEFPTAGNESSDGDVNYLTSSQIDKTFGTSASFHETTRKASVFTTPNSRPSIILAGQYTIDGKSSSQTLYRQGNKIFTEDELIEYFAKINNETQFYNGYPLYFFDGDYKVKYDYENIKKQMDVVFSIMRATDNALTTSSMPNFVTIQISLNGSDKTKLLDMKSMNAISTSEYAEINKKLAEEIGLWEVYDQGKCFFHIPIEHLGKATDSDGSRTGSYGLVRNHHYNITVNSIEGMGIGMPEADTYIGEWSYPESFTIEKNVNYSVSVNPWNEVNQSIDIPKQ